MAADSLLSEQSVQLEQGQGPSVDPAQPCSSKVPEEASAGSEFAGGPALLSKILKQVEFYFGDANLPKDKFLLSKAHENADSWVPVETICSFSRVKSLTTDVPTVAEALRGSQSLLQVSEDGLSVRRKSPLEHSSAAPRDDLMCTLYAKGFPKDSTLDDISSFLETISKDVLAIRMRRFPKDKTFKGSCYVEFPSKEEVDRIKEGGLSYSGHSLELMSKLDHLKEKNLPVGKEESPQPDTDKNLLIKLTNIPSGCGFSHLKEALSRYCQIGYISLEPGSDHAFARINKTGEEDELDASRVIEKAGQSGLALESFAESSPVLLSVPTEDEVRAFFDERASKMKQQPKGRGKRTKKMRHN